MAKTYLSKAKSAKDRGISFELSFAEYKRLRNCKTCHLTGVKLTPKTFSLDRLNKQIGYVKGNVVACHKVVNMLKGTLENPTNDSSVELLVKVMIESIKLMDERSL